MGCCSNVGIDIGQINKYIENYSKRQNIYFRNAPQPP